MSKPAGRNNSKIITRNQGGGNKLQGLAPVSTPFYMAQSTGQSYYTETGDGRNRDFVLCVNQLGGIGRGRSQFRANADGNRGTGCNPNPNPSPLLSVYFYVSGTPENALYIYVNPVNNIENLFPGISSQQGISGEQTTLTYGNIELSMTPNAIIQYINIDSYFGMFVIQASNIYTFNQVTYSKLQDILPAATPINQDQNIFNLISGLSFTISIDGISRTFNSLNNEIYNYLIINNNWYNVFNS
tara:strand:+ start:1181 stop:1909 length:729 start_codon:yes stop_codon:yes gene_type:complete